MILIKSISTDGFTYEFHLTDQEMRSYERDKKYKKLKFTIREGIIIDMLTKEPFSKFIISHGTKNVTEWLELDVMDFYGSFNQEGNTIMLLTLHYK